MKQSLGEKLKARRKELGLTQSHIAALAGIAPSHYGHLEYGVRKNPSISTALKLSTALTIPFSDFEEYAKQAIDENV